MVSACRQHDDKPVFNGMKQHRQGGENTLKDDKQALVTTIGQSILWITLWESTQ